MQPTKNFLTDAEMAQLQGTSGAPASTQNPALPDFIPDSEAPKFFNNTNTPPAAPKPFKFDVQLTPQEQKVNQNMKVSRLQQDAAKSAAEAKSANSVGGFLYNAAKELPFIGAPIRQGEATGQQLATPEVADSLVKTKTQQEATKVNLLKTIRDKKAAGQDTHNLEVAYNRTVDDSMDVEKELDAIVPKWRQSYPEAIGNVGEMALDILTAGTYGKGATGMATGELSTVKNTPSAVQAVRNLASKPSGLFTAKGATRVATGAVTGYGYDVASGLQGKRGEDRTGKNAFIPGAGTIIGAAVPTVTEGIQSVKNFKVKAQQKAVNDLEDKYTELFTGTKPGRNKLDKAEAITALKDKAGTTGRTPQRVLAENGIIPKQEGADLATFDQANAFRETTKPLREANRAALAEVSRATPAQSLDDLERAAVDRVRSPANIDAGTADDLENEIHNAFSSLKKEYGPTVDLTKLDDIKTARWGKTKFNSTRPLQGDANYNIAKTIQQTIENVSKTAGFDDVAQLNREIGDRLEGAKFLESLNGQKVKGGRLGKYVFMTIGSTMGKSIPAKIVGALGGDAVANILISNSVADPVKRLILKNLQTKDPAAYIATLKWLDDQNLLRDMRLALPAPSGVQPDNPTLFTGAGAKPTQSLGEAVDVANVENGAIKAPTAGARSIPPDVLFDEPHVAPEDLPVIPFGKTPKKAVSDLPVAKEAPQVYTSLRPEARSINLATKTANNVANTGITKNPTILLPKSQAGVSTAEAYVTRTAKELTQYLEDPDVIAAGMKPNMPSMIRDIQKNIVDGITRETNRTIKQSTIEKIADLRPEMFTSIDEFVNATLKILKGKNPLAK